MLRRFEMPSSRNEGHEASSRKNGKESRPAPSTLGAFGKLPREIRDRIYAHLLVSRYTFDADASPQASYHAELAILRANRQIGAEATQALYKANRFVILNLQGDAERNFAWSIHGTGLQRAPAFDVADALLTANISPVGAAAGERDTRRFIVLFPESVDTVLEAVWDFIIGAWEVGRIEPVAKLRIELVLHPVLLARRDALQKELLRPFERLVGFGGVDVHGCADEAFRHTVIHRMEHLPAPESFTQNMQAHLELGRAAYEAKRYNEARDHWARAEKYHGSTVAIAQARARTAAEEEGPAAEVLLAAVAGSSRQLQRARVGVMKAGLRQRSYVRVLREFYGWAMEEEEEMRPLLRAQVLLIAAMAFHRSAVFDLGRKLLQQAQNVVILDAVQHMDHVLAIAHDIAWAEQWHYTAPGYSFFAAWESCWGLVEAEERVATEAGGSAEGEGEEGGEGPEGELYWGTTEEEEEEEEDGAQGAVEEDDGSW
ncbi:hypothetical protein MMC26_003341 [Xylographa opegraphella]|nr:hypothetical protein [Xylographa opegraphella]